ncbi:MAG: adenylate/guanylate cyclase domain-containing protein [Anaerolineae bacterium]|nr:adenylate/guanylate cyclase domain-containing protein [Anaerolineae bacterium]
MTRGLRALLKRIEQRLALPGDDETQRIRKVAAFVAGASGVVTAALFAALYYVGGAPQLSRLYLLTVVWTGVTLAILVYRPRTYYGAVLVTSIFVTIHPWVVVIASGGIRSGLLPMFWALVGPAAGLLLIGIRPASLNVLIYTGMATVTILLDPQLTGRVPALPEWVTQSAALISALVPGTMVLLISLYLFQQLERAQRQADQLLLNILPRPIAEQLKQSHDTIADDYSDVTVMFADIVDFTRMSAAANPCDVVELLNAIFSDLDQLADQYGLEKIKTIGDAYMVVGGLRGSGPDHTAAVVAYAIDVLNAVKAHRAPNGKHIRLRIGIHHGPTVAGVIGRRKFIYDLWGDTVNTASRMESYGLADAIQVTQAVQERLGDRYAFEPRGPIAIKGKGQMMTYILRPDRAERSP